MKRIRDYFSNLSKKQSIYVKIFISLILIIVIVLPLLNIMTGTVDYHRDSVHWEEGAQNSDFASFALSFDILTVNLKESKSFKVQWSMKVKESHQMQIFFSQPETQTEILDMVLYQHIKLPGWHKWNWSEWISNITQIFSKMAPTPTNVTQTPIIEIKWPPYDLYNETIYRMFFPRDIFTNYAGDIDYTNSGTPAKLPFDEYVFRFRFHNLSSIKIIDEAQIYVDRKCSDKDWKISEFNVIFNETDDLLDVAFGIKRTTKVIFIDLILPLFLFSIMPVVVRLNDPQAPYTKSSNNKEIRINQKFRVDSARWILAFAIATLLLEEFLWLDTIKGWISIVALIFCLIFYLTSKYQGEHLETWVNFYAPHFGLLIFPILIALAII